MKSFNVIIEGNIGAGKSTLLSALKYEPHYVVWPEPIDVWCNTFLNGKNVLEQIYVEPEIYGCVAQQVILNSLYTRDLIAHSANFNKNRINIFERGFNSAVNVFAQQMKADGNINSSQFSIIEKLAATYCKITPIEIDAYIFIDLNPKVIMERIGNRNRFEEATVSKQYIDNLKYKYDILKHDILKDKNQVPLLVLNGTKTIDENKKEITEFIKGQLYEHKLFL